MSTYTHILVGLDLSEESAQVLNKANAIARAFKAKISIAHILEPLSFAYGGDMPIDLSDVQNALEEQAIARLEKIARENAVETSEQIVTIGSTASQLHRLAADHKADLIVVGSHGRHGIALLFGSTSNDVLHGTKCDVLAVRVQQ